MTTKKEHQHHHQDSQHHPKQINKLKEYVYAHMLIVVTLLVVETFVLFDVALYHDLRLGFY